MRLNRALFASFSLLTLIPPFGRAKIDESDLRNSVIFFPVVGYILGFASSLVFFLSSSFFSREISILLYLLLLIILTGGFHLDGLSDTFDGLSVKSKGERTEDIKRRLSVMSSGNQGPLGSAAVLFDFLLRFAFMKDIVTFAEWPIFLTIAPAFSRSCLVFSMFSGKSAKNEGLGQIFIGKIGTCHLVLCLSIFFAIYLALTQSFKMIVFSIFAFSAAFLSLLGLKKLFERKFGGMTGDNLGAVNEFSEVLFLMFGLLALKFF